MSSNIFDRFSFLSLFLVVVLLPVFCLPFTNIPIGVSKGLLLVLGLAATVVFYVIARFFDGKIVLPKSSILLSGAGVVLAFLLSALIAKSSEVSLFGSMLDVGSFYFILAGFVFMFLASIVFRTPKRAKTVLLGAILSSSLVLIFQSVHLFFPKILSLRIPELVDKTGNLIGSWNALGLFAGFFTLMLLLVVEFFPISKIEKIILQVVMLFSVLLSVIASSANFKLVWALLGVFSLIIFVYKISTTFLDNNEEEKKNFPIASFAVMLISLLFFTSGQFIGNFIPTYLGINNTEVNPSFSATYAVAKGTITKNPLFGLGPNRFEEAWAAHRPIEINTTVEGNNFWNISFGSGVGLLPTFMSTTGIVGFLSLVVFLVLFLLVGVRSIFSSIKNKVNWEMVAFFILTLYLFVASFFYFTGAVIFLLSLAFTGIFVGLVSSNSGKEITISFLNDHRKSFFYILALILVAVLSVAVFFKYAERFAAYVYFEKSLYAGTMENAERFINKAVALYPNDLYLRTYAEISLYKLSSAAGKNSLSDEEKSQLQVNFNQAVKGAQLAIEYDPSNYLNFVSLSSVYQTAGSLGVKDAYAEAIESYKNASLLNPLNPGLKLTMAEISFQDGKAAEAKSYAEEAIKLKPDYLDALITLSRIAKEEGNKTEALSYAETALAYAEDPKYALGASDIKTLSDYVNSLK